MDTEEIKAGVASFFNFARERYVAGYFSISIQPEEVLFTATLVAYLRLPAPDQEAIRASVADAYDAYYLADFAVRNASFAVQLGDVEKLKHAFSSLIIDSDVLDSRALFGALSILNAAANSMGINVFEKIVAPMWGIVALGRRRLIHDFFFHPDSTRDFQKLGYELVNADGFSWFRRKVNPTSQPKHGEDQRAKDE